LLIFENFLAKKDQLKQKVKQMDFLNWTFEIFILNLTKN